MPKEFGDLTIFTGGNIYQLKDNKRKLLDDGDIITISVLRLKQIIETASKGKGGFL